MLIVNIAVQVVLIKILFWEKQPIALQYGNCFTNY